MSHCASEDHTDHTVDLGQLFKTDMFHTKGYRFQQIDFLSTERYECLEHMPRNLPKKMVLNLTACRLAQPLQATQLNGSLLKFLNIPFVPDLAQTKELTLTDSLPIFPELGIYSPGNLISC